MENDRTGGQGQVDLARQMDDAALAHARALQASSPRLQDGLESSGGEGAGGTVSDDAGSGVQSAPLQEGEGGTPPPASEGGGSGQGFLEPYLSEVPEEQREIVAPVLERYRAEQDANFNRRFEQLQEEARVPTTIYQSLLQDPIQTMNWIADRMQEERGVDVRSQLLSRWQEGQQGQPPQGQEGQPQPTGDDGADKPLTKAELDQYLKEQEEQRQQQAKQEAWQQQQVQKQQETVNNWIDEAAGKFSLGLDDSNGEDPLRAVIIMQANQLHESGVARGQAAIEMAAESVAKRFGKASSGNANGNGSGEQPRTANGGTPPPPREIDVSDTKQRKARMLELFPPSE